jgi:diacylglycerol kinase family enzyme
MTDHVRVGRRLAAVGALVLLVAIPFLALAGLYQHFYLLVVVWVALACAAAGAWWAMSRRGIGRVIGVVGVVGGLTATIVIFIVEHRLLWLVLLFAVMVIAIGLAKVALAQTSRALKAAASVVGVPVGSAKRPVLLMNPKSGGGKVERFDLAVRAQRRGIEPIVLQPGDDLLELARNAADNGADVIGMAGGDGSQALVASIAAEYGVAHVCIPAGTRNHFALDLGLDRSDVIGALDAYADGAIERRIDLAKIGDRIFVNNAALGVYAQVVQSDEYRDAKLATTAARLPELLGPTDQRPTLRFRGPDGHERDRADLILISNNPYQLTRIGGTGSRPHLDTGQLGIVALQIRNAAEMTQLVSLETLGKIRSFRGYGEWTTDQFEVDSDHPIDVGVDGEALTLDPPLRFQSVPGALRIRIPANAPGYSPSATAVRFTSRHDLTNLLRVVAGEQPLLPDTEPAATTETGRDAMSPS